MNRILGVVLAALLIGVGLQPAQAADEAQALRLRAERLAAADRCDEALPRAQQARALAPDDARAALVEGRCLLRLNRYEEAIAPLEAARRLDPSIEGLALDLAMCHYHRGQFAAADLELKQAERETPDEARVSLYRGLLLLEQAEDAEAAAALERAGRLDAAVDPAATFYAGLAWERARERDRARESLERTRELAPGTPWAEQATLALGRVDPPPQRHYWASVVLGMEFDTNVVLRGTGVTLPNEIADEQDGRGVWGVDGGLEFLRTEDWSAGGLVSYRGNAHIDLRQFDYDSPTVSLWLHRRVDERSFLEVKPFYGFSWRDGNHYLETAGGDVGYHRTYENAGSGELFVRGSWNDFRFRTPDEPFLVTAFLAGPSAGLWYVNDALRSIRNRDGVELRVGYDHRYTLRPGSTLRGAVSYLNYNSVGAEWQHQGGEVLVGLRQDLPFDFTADVDASFAHEPYRHPSSFLSPVWPYLNTSDRVDNRWRARVGIERPITKNVTASAQYIYTHNNSNTDVFRYSRHIVGGYLTISFNDVFTH